jgi:hypothetical protein
MEFQTAEKRRFLELVEEHWDKGTGAIDISVIVRHLRAEDLNVSEAGIGEMLRGIELAEAASVLSETDAEKDRGKAVIWRLDKQRLEQVRDSVR